MNLAVIIPTYGRKALLARTLAHLASQSRLPDRTIVSAPDSSHVEIPADLPFDVVVVTGCSGASAQRNCAMEQIVDDSDIISFFDDDFLQSSHYLARVEEGFRRNPDWAVATGRVVVDGANGPGLTFDEGCQELRKAEQRDVENAVGDGLGDIEDRVGGYGCNMSIRSSLVRSLRFDERLPLYSWQEDTDFSTQLGSRGRVVGVSGLLGVHLGVKTGRVSGVRFGYSQISNLIYLMAKGTVPLGYGSELMIRNIAANLVRSFWPESYVDRLGRLKGNLLAARHLLVGRIEPEYILKL
ncbi:MAG: glycosyltransferase family 2 protein [Hyphomicrobiaceae bacterium]